MTDASLARACRMLGPDGCITLGSPAGQSLTSSRREGWGLAALPGVAGGADCGCPVPACAAAARDEQLRARHGGGVGRGLPRGAQRGHQLHGALLGGPARAAQAAGAAPGLRGGRARLPRRAARARLPPPALPGAHACIMARLYYDCGGWQAGHCFPGRCELCMKKRRCSWCATDDQSKGTPCEQQNADIGNRPAHAGTWLRLRARRTCCRASRTGSGSRAARRAARRRERAWRRPAQARAPPRRCRRCSRPLPRRPPGPTRPF